MSEGGFLGVPSTCVVEFYQQIGQGCPYGTPHKDLRKQTFDKGMLKKLKRAVRLNCPYGTPHTDPRKLTFDKEMLKKLKRAVRLIKLGKLGKLIKLTKLTKTVRGGEGVFLYRKQR